MSLSKEWGNENAILDRKNLYFPPEDSVLQKLFQIYFDESVRIFGKNYSENQQNSVNHLIKEMKLFWLLTQLSMALPFMKLLDDDYEFPKELLFFFGGKRPDKLQIMVTSN